MASSVYFALKVLFYAQWRSDQWNHRIGDDHPDIGESKIHSIQNGILLSQNAHAYFDKYIISINPDVCKSVLGHYAQSRSNHSHHRGNRYINIPGIYRLP